MSTAAPRILVVDDEPANRRLLEAILAPEFGRPVHAGDGQAALDAFEREPFDLVVADVMMPHVDGLELCRRIRAHPAGAFVPVILVTALADAASRAGGKIAGADDFLTKPILEEELLARTRNLLRMRAYQLEIVAQRTAAELAAERWRLAATLAGEVVHARNYDRLLQQIWTLLEDRLQLACAGVFTVDGDALHLTSLCGGPAPSEGPTRWPWAAARWQAPAGALRAIRAFSDDPTATPVSDLLRVHGLAEAHVVPVVGAGDVHGLLVLGHATPATPAACELVELLTPFLSGAVNNIRLHVRAERLLRAREELTQLVIHDLRGPLANAQLNQRCALDSTTEPELVEILHDAVSATDRAVALVADLLDASTAEEGRLRLTLTTTDLGGLTALVATRAAGGRRGPAVQLQLADVLADVDRRLMQRVLENLLDNAQRHTPKGGEIRITLVRDGAIARLTLHNDGPPLTAAVRARLFEKYAGTVDDERSRGLGLYFCRLVVEAHGGAIRALTPDAGVAFEVSVPCRPLTPPDD